MLGHAQSEAGGQPADREMLRESRDGTEEEIEGVLH